MEAKVTIRRCWIGDELIRDTRIVFGTAGERPGVREHITLVPISGAATIKDHNYIAAQIQALLIDPSIDLWLLKAVRIALIVVAITIVVDPITAGRLRLPGFGVGGRVLVIAVITTAVRAQEAIAVEILVIGGAAAVIVDGIATDLIETRTRQGTCRHTVVAVTVAGGYQVAITIGAIESSVFIIAVSAATTLGARVLSISIEILSGEPVDTIAVVIDPVVANLIGIRVHIRVAVIAIFNIIKTVPIIIDWLITARKSRLRAANDQEQQADRQSKQEPGTRCRHNNPSRGHIA